MNDQEIKLGQQWTRRVIGYDIIVHALSRREVCYKAVGDDGLHINSLAMFEERFELRFNANGSPTAPAVDPEQPYLSRGYRRYPFDRFHGSRQKDGVVYASIVTHDLVEPGTFQLIGYEFEGLEDNFFGYTIRYKRGKPIYPKYVIVKESA